MLDLDGKGRTSVVTTLRFSEGPSAITGFSGNGSTASKFLENNLAEKTTVAVAG